MRIRSADFRDGHSEQVVNTLNASRKGFYFHTTLGHYYAGMRVRIIAPYNDHVRAGDSEEMAEVIRVDQKSGAFGIAIIRGVSQDERPAVVEFQSVAVRASVASERRSHGRASLVAAAEMTEMLTGTITRSRTADLSISGCYIDTLNPLPLGTDVELLIQNADENLKVQASVCTHFQGSGMGLVFDPLTVTQRSIVRKWLGSAPSGDASA